jgi:hypothetical protein
MFRGLVMRRVRFAERLLSKVATPERAASIVGDLVETSPGETMFWVSVLRIGVSLLWKDVAAHPVRMAGLATAGAAMNIIMLAPFGAAWFLLLIAFGLLGAALHRDMTIAATPMFVVMVVCAAIPAPFMTGRWIARRSAGKELAPCLVLSVLAFAVWGAFFLADGSRISVMNGLEGEWPTLGWLAVATSASMPGRSRRALRPDQHGAGLSGSLSKRTGRGARGFGIYSFLQISSSKRSAMRFCLWRCRYCSFECPMPFPIVCSPRWDS